MDQSAPVLERLLGLHPKEIDLSLGRLEALLAKLGNPERRLPPTVHIAGTNGKGSTTAFMRAMLEAGGKSVHVYTSPHLVRFHERIRLGAPDGGRFVSDAVLKEALERAERINDGAEITFFEISTAVAFCLFADHPADVLLLEVGLGGRFDATNVIDTPAASIITSISLDHERFLGDRLDGIAREKAGILRPGVPAVIAPQLDEVREVIEAEAAALGTPLLIGGQDWSAFEEAGRLVYQDEGGLLDLPRPKLPGQHQIINAGAAIAALRAGNLWPGREAAEHGLTHVVWPARLQRLTAGKLFDHVPEDTDIWLDGGHNPGAGVVVASAMADLEDKLDRPLYMVSGMLNTKDPHGYFQPFEGLVKQVVTVPLISSAAGIPAEDLAQAATRAGLVCEASTGIAAALERIRELSGGTTPRVLICGSLYLAGDALSFNGTPPE